MIIKEGMILNHRYKIDSLAGQGGMARVYKAIDLQSGHTIAIKALKDELSDDAEFVRRFDLEARSAASLSHPNIVRVYGVGEDKGMRYIAQEYIEGHSLKEEIAERGRLDWRVATPIAIQIALALEHAHDRGIIHRDIKPANILMTTDGVAMVTDFGIAHAVNSNTVTSTGGNALGSVHYFSPEQAKGSKVSNKTDIYSLGIVMYEMVTGKIPFDGDSSVAVAVKQLQEAPIRPKDLVPSIPQGFEDIILRCMQKSADLRYESARQLIDDLDSFMINPNGRYGIMQRPLVDSGSTTKPLPKVTVDKADTYGKVLNLEKDIEKRRTSRVRDTILATVVILIGVAALVIGINYLVGQIGDNISITTRAETRFQITDYTNMRFDEVAAMLTAEGINYTRVDAHHERYAPGTIIEQNIPNGTSVDPESTFLDGNELILTVSIGSEYVVIPDLSGYTAAEASALLASDTYGLTVGEIQAYSFTVGAGQIISVSPQPQSTVKRGSRVDLTVSRGRNDGQVPDVRKQQLNSALQFLRGQGFEAEAVVPSYLLGQEANLYVIRMDPSPGTTNAGRITLYAGTYTEAFPPPPTTPAPTEAPTEPPVEEPTDPVEEPTSDPEPEPEPEPVDPPTEG